jgi:ElaB/YqjD/DUF883 family membrane-anchored ribosome-binding protein
MDAKEVKKVVDTNIAKAKAKGAELEGATLKELKKIQKEMEDASKKIGAYVKKNPEKAAIIAAGVGAALGTVAGIFMGSKKKK